MFVLALLDAPLILYCVQFKVEDPDPSNPWTLDEIYEIMESERNIDPDCWNMWVLLAGSYRYTVEILVKW